jgi:rhamnose utilization protein RhaD (predicted bifunctional aldolase and dehydrogenase)
MNNPESVALEALISLSNHYGSQTDYVIAGGGNTSWKNAATLWVKGSGQSLGTIKADGFAKIDRAALTALWAKTFSADKDEREKQVLECLLAARLPGEEAKRPSVETLLHDLLPFAYVVHTHPTLVNALTCAQGGKAAFDRLFAAEAVWIPLVDPGYVLSKVVKDALEAFRTRHGRVPQVIFLQNHGIVVAGDTPEAIRATYDRVGGVLAAETKLRARLDGEGVNAAAEAAFLAALVPVARKALGTDELFSVRATGATVLEMAASAAAFAPLASAFTPDHIVYMGVSPVRVDAADQLAQAFADYTAKYGKPPRVVLTPGLGAFCLGTSAKNAGQAHLLFLDAVKIAVASQAFGGPLFMTTKSIDFIRNWEVEAFRSKVSSGK